MRDVVYFFELARGTLLFMAYFLPVTMMVAGLWLTGLIASRNRVLDRKAQVAFCCVLPGILTMAVLVVGVVFQVPKLPEVISESLKLPLAALLGWWSGCRWPVVVASSLVWDWATLCASIMAGMSVSGDWI